MSTEQPWLQKPRPVNLNLLTIRFPVTAIVSILHRLSGVVLFLFVPFLLWVLNQTLASPDDFTNVQHLLMMPVCKWFIWGFISALIYHLLAGTRHLIMDFGLGESLRAARLSSWLVISIAILFSVALGIWLW